MNYQIVFRTEFTDAGKWVRYSPKLYSTVRAAKAGLTFAKKSAPQTPAVYRVITGPLKNPIVQEPFAYFYEFEIAGGAK